MTTIRIKVPLFVEPDGDGFYVSCPALPGLHTGGNTFEEAIRNGKDAVNAYLLSLMKKGESLPVGCDTQTAQIAELRYRVKRALSGDLYALLTDIQNGIDAPGHKDMANSAIQRIDALLAILEEDEA